MIIGQIGFWGSVLTVAAFVTFLVAALWSFARVNKEPFDRAAQAPFDLPDDTDEIPTSKPRN